MDADEHAIYYYLKSVRPKFAPLRDIARRTGSKRKFRYDPEWVRPVLLRMEERGIVEADAQGSYHLKPIPLHEFEGKSWASPEIAKILKASGKGFNAFITPDDEDEYYERL